MKQNATLPRNYIICTVQRSGKTWLCSILKRLKQFGAPEEYFAGVNKLGDHLLDDNFLGLRNFVLKNNSDQTGYSRPAGLVIQSIQLQLIAKRIKINHIEIFQKLLKCFDNPIIYFLKREDVAAQAVSHYFMVKTGIAHSYQDNSKKNHTYDNIEYNQAEILKWYDFTLKGYEFWNDIFVQSSIEPYYVIYEDLKSNPYETIFEITRQIDNKIPLTSSQVIQASQKGIQKIPISKKNDFTIKFKNFLHEKHMIRK